MLRKVEMMPKRPMKMLSEESRKISGDSSQARVWTGGFLLRGCWAGDHIYMVLYQVSWGRCVRGRGVILPVPSQRMVKMILKL